MSRKFFQSLVLILFVFLTTSLTVLASDKNKKDELFKQVELFSDTLVIVQTDYVTEVSPHDLIYGALKGMLASLDPHSQFLDPETYNELKVDTEGKFGGLGIEITVKDGLLTVVTPIEDTPAWRAGLKANDRIVKIGNELTRDMTITDAVKKLRGKVGEPVNISILRESEKKLLDFRIVRDTIKIRDIKDAKIIAQGIGYVRLIEFRENTVKELVIALDRLKKDGMKAFILDLRNNPGGLLDIAVKVCERFIEKGKILLSTQGRINTQNLEFISRANDPILDLPMVVLINEGSASGSEIVAGCLQDYKRAIILGIRSFGKGSVQTVIPLRDGSALRLTTSKYFTPLGREIHNKGVTPDIVVEDGRIEPIDKKEVQEEKSQEIFEQLEKKEKNSNENPVEPDKFKTDRQIMSAVDVLKGVLIYKAK